MTPNRSDDNVLMAKYYENLGHQIWKVCPAILLVVGTLGNVLSVLVLSREAMRRSNAAIYLIVLAMMDTMVLYTGLLRQWLRETIGMDVRDFSDASCRVHTWLVYASLDTSVWVLVALTFERLVSVYLPYRIKEYCTTMTSTITLLVIGGVMLGINSHFLYGMGRVYKMVNGTLVMKTKCDFRFDDYAQFANIVWPWIDLCIFSIIPLFIVITFNIAITVKVCLSRHRARRVQPSGTAFASRSRSRNPDGRKISSMTATLVVLNLVLTITTVPVSTFIILLPSLNKTYDTRLGQAKVAVAWAIVNALQYTNNAINFLLYCISGSRFREELKAMFRRGRRVTPFTVTQSRITDPTLSRPRTRQYLKAIASHAEGAEINSITASTTCNTTIFTTRGASSDQSNTACTKLCPRSAVSFVDPVLGKISPPCSEHLATEDASLASNAEGKSLHPSSQDPDGKCIQEQDPGAKCM
ncbi:hypothetical protein ACOMHN_048494 [Nucella lapillus]